MCVFILTKFQFSDHGTALLTVVKAILFELLCLTCAIIIAAN